MTNNDNVLQNSTFSIGSANLGARSPNTGAGSRMALEVPNSLIWDLAQFNRIETNTNSL